MILREKLFKYYFVFISVAAVALLALGKRSFFFLSQAGKWSEGNLWKWLGSPHANTQISLISRKL